MLYTFRVWRGADPIDVSGHKTMLERLTSLREQGYMPEEFGALIRSMLSWDPADRPTAKQALDHGVWLQQGITAAMVPNTHKRQHSYTSSERDDTGGSGIGTKRMRRSNGQCPSSPPGSGSRGLEMENATVRQSTTTRAALKSEPETCE